VVCPILTTLDGISIKESYVNLNIMAKTFGTADTINKKSPIHRMRLGIKFFTMV
jgi:hypothetical protein